MAQCPFTDIIVDRQSDDQIPCTGAAPPTGCVRKLRLLGFSFSETVI